MRAAELTCRFGVPERWPGRRKSPWQAESAIDVMAGKPAQSRRPDDETALPTSVCGLGPAAGRPSRAGPGIFSWIVQHQQRICARALRTRT